MANGTAIYEILDVAVDATSNEIRSAFLKKARERHPDHNPDDPDATEKFNRVKKAYDLLMDDGKRKLWHRKHGLAWLWDSKPKTKPGPKFDPDKPPADLNWICVACSSVPVAPSYRCASCDITLCGHAAFMLTLEGYAPRPVCVSCKQRHNEKNHAHWHLIQMMKDKMGGKL